MVKIETVATVLACSALRASCYTCSNDVVTLPDGGLWGCTITPSAPTVFSNPELKINSFNKESGCGSDGTSAFIVRITCDGTYTYLPIGGGHWGSDGHSVDEHTTGAWNCQSFRMDTMNYNSQAGLGSCVTTYSGWTMSVNQQDMDDSNDVVSGGNFSGPVDSNGYNGPVDDQTGYTSETGSETGSKLSAQEEVAATYDHGTLETKCDEFFDSIDGGATQQDCLNFCSANYRCYYATYFVDSGYCQIAVTCSYTSETGYNPIVYHKTSSGLASIEMV
jgi:hypothetical protein